MTPASATFVRKATVALTALGWSAVAAAQAVPGWTTPSIIASVIPVENGLNVVLPASNNPMGCSSTTWVRISSTDPNYTLIASTILTAFSQGKPIKTYQNGCYPDGAARLTAVWVDR